MSKLKLQKPNPYSTANQQNKQAVKYTEEELKQQIIEASSANIVLQKALEIACSCENCSDWCFCEKTDTEACNYERVMELVRRSQNALLGKPNALKEYIEKYKARQII